MATSRNSSNGKVPADFEPRQCYERIYAWHRKFGKEKIKEIYRKKDRYSLAYLALVDSLPDPGSATDADMQFVFGQVIADLMEWAYRLKDEYGIMLADYAHLAKEKGFNASEKESTLYQEFNRENRRKRFG